jgi:hypothetical protein
MAKAFSADLENVRFLRQFATPTESATLDALIEHGSCRAAARALGKNNTSVLRALERVKRRAEQGIAPKVPNGHRLKGISTLSNPTGETIEQWVKTERDSDDPPRFEPVPAGHHVSKVSTLLDAQGQVRAQWIQSPHDKIAQEQALIAALRESIAEYVRPVEPVDAPSFVDSDLLALYPLGDPHIGMLAHALECGEDFDLKICERDMLGAMDRLVAGMPPAETGVLVPMGDNFHADDDNQRTPAHHHKVDVDSRSHKVGAVGVNIMRRLIDRGLQKHRKMIVRVISGNHDPVTSMWLRLCLEGWYAHEPRVEVVTDVSAVQVFEFGKNMVALAHGDGVKPENMPGVMAARHGEMWGRTKFRYALQGHKHQAQLFEKHGAMVRVVRTLAGKDSFAAKFGHESGRSAIGITLHKLYGEIDLKTVDVSLARVA